MLGTARITNEEMRTHRLLDEVDGLTLEGGGAAEGDIHVRGAPQVDVRLEITAWSLGRLGRPCKHQSSIFRVKYCRNVSSNEMQVMIYSGATRNFIRQR